MANIPQIQESKSAKFRNSDLALFTYGTVFFPRLFTYFGAPSPLNLAHLLVVPWTLCVILTNSRIKDKKQAGIIYELILALGIFLAVMITSALINNTGWVNIVAQFLLQSQPFMFLITIMGVSFSQTRLTRFRRWLLGFALFNLLLALAQSVLLPIGLYPRKGGTIADNTAGVFAGERGSAGNYVSCTASVYFALYFFKFKAVPLWIRLLILLASFYQVYISDSKQVFLALFVGWIALVITKFNDPAKLLMYTVLVAVCAVLFWWALYNFEFMTPYLNWIDRPELYGPNGEATQTKLAAFRLIPEYYSTPLNHLFGLGPGHTVTRLGGWMLKKYSGVLVPLGATLHPVSREVFDVVTEGWIAQESTIFFPLFTWAGMWGDVGIFGVMSYLYIAFIMWRRVCVDDLGKFLLLSTGVLGFFLTQMEEPGHMLTVTCLLALSWQDHRLGYGNSP